MTASEDGSRVTDIQERIIELAVEQDEARHRHDPARASQLEDEIARLAAEYDRLRRET